MLTVMKKARQKNPGIFMGVSEDYGKIEKEVLRGSLPDRNLTVCFIGTVGKTLEPDEGKYDWDSLDS
jgi:hypothetical protein